MFTWNTTSATAYGARTSEGLNTAWYLFQYIIGCHANCSDVPKNGSCSAAAGCCELDVPTDLGFFEAFFNTDYSSSSGCGYISYWWKRRRSDTARRIATQDRSGMNTRVKFQWWWTGVLDRPTRATKLNRTSPHTHVSATRASVSTPPTDKATAASAWTGIKAIRTSTVDAQVCS